MLISKAQRKQNLFLFGVTDMCVAYKYVRLFKFRSVFGMLPVRLLLERSKLMSCVKFPSSHGIGPEILLFWSILNKKRRHPSTTFYPPFISSSIMNLDACSASTFTLNILEWRTLSLSLSRKTCNCLWFFLTDASAL